MRLEDCKPGLRVFLMIKGVKTCGTVGKAYSFDGTSFLMIRFDDDSIIYLDELVVSFVKTEIIN